MSWTVMSDYESHEEAVDNFDWNIPEDYDPVDDLLRKHENSDNRVALYRDYPLKPPGVYTFGEIDRLSDKLAQTLQNLGLGWDDRVGVALPQCLENPVSHLAIWKIGGITVPLTILFGRKSLRYRIDDAGIKTCIISSINHDVFSELAHECESLRNILSIDSNSPENITSLNEILIDDGSEFEKESLDLTDSSAILYTSGSTGPPKGVLHSFGIWLGRAAAHRNFLDQYGEDSVVWTPADWSWGMALGGTLLGAWHHGTPVVAAPMQGFDPGRAYTIMEYYDVTHAVVPPTALRMMMEIVDPADEYELSLEAFASAGESLTPEIVDWVYRKFDDVSINEFYGQTELNLVVGNCSSWFDTKPGSMGKVFPGYDVRILDPETRDPLKSNETGEIALRPEERNIFFKKYWDQPEATENKMHDGWFLTGDLARKDDQGYIWFKSRKDDLIITSGYRVGPSEVEETILEHPQVEQAGVIGVPDEKRGEIIKAFVQMSDDNDGTDQVRDEIKDLVRSHLAEYQYPREIEFLNELPTTTTGKIRRTELRNMIDRGQT